MLRLDLKQDIFYFCHFFFEGWWASAALHSGCVFLCDYTTLSVNFVNYLWV